jgi:hypothetical protein
MPEEASKQLQFDAASLKGKLTSVELNKKVKVCTCSVAQRCVPNRLD